MGIVDASCKFLLFNIHTLYLDAGNFTFIQNEYGLARGVPSEQLSGVRGGQNGR